MEGRWVRGGQRVEQRAAGCRALTLGLDVGESGRAWRRMMEQRGGGGGALPGYMERRCCCGGHRKAAASGHHLTGQTENNREWITMGT